MSDVLKIGKTNYYSVRKGTHQYRIAEGKRLTDLDYCWMLQKDPKRGKHFFVNGNGNRRWYLPDIYMTDKEREDELMELKIRKEAKEKLDAKKEGDGDGDKGEDGDKKEGEGDDKKAEEIPESEKTFAAREKQAAQLKPLKEWEDVDNKRQVIKFVKSVIAPYLTQGVLDDRNYTAIVSVATKEFCASTSKLGEAEQAKLKDDIVTMALTRITEDKKREEFAKMNDELMDKVKRLDDEKRTAVSNVQEMQKNEDRMKDEIFKLRAHKQDILLGSFKRLTKAGLVQAYWKRWIHHKGVVDAQVDVKARERRTLEMTNKIIELQALTAEQKDEIWKLNDRVHKAEGRDVVAMMLKQSGTQTMKRSYFIWIKWTEEARREKQIHRLREQLVNCPICELRQIETERVRDTLGVMIEQLKEKERVLVESQAQQKQWEVKCQQQAALVQELHQSIRDANGQAASFSARMMNAEDHAGQADEQIRFLQNEKEKLEFEVGFLQETQDAHAKVEAQQKSLGAGVPPHLATAAITAAQGGAGQRNALDRSSFWASEVTTGQDKLHKLVVANRGEDAATATTIANTTEPTRGLVHNATSSALAPLVHPSLPPRSVPGDAFDDTLNQSRGLPTNQHPHQNPSGTRGGGAGGGKQDILLHSHSTTAPPVGRVLGNHLSQRILDEDGYEKEDSLSRFYEDDDTTTNDDRTSTTMTGGGGAQNQIQQRGLSQSSGAYNHRSPLRNSPNNAARSPPGGKEGGYYRDPQNPAPVPDEDGKCDKCGFKKKLTQFCPRDGSRHLFAAFSSDYRESGSHMHKNYHTSPGPSSEQVRTGTSVSTILTGTNKESRLTATLLGVGGGGGAGMAGGMPTTASNAPGLDAKMMGLPPSKETLAKRKEQVEQTDIREMLNLDPGAFSDPTALPPRATAKAQYDTSHYREVADLMRATRLSTENAIQVDRALGREQPTKVRSVLDSNPVNAPQQFGGQQRPQQGGQAGAGSRWGGLFDFSDVTDGTLGVTTESVDHVFGVYRGDTMPAEPPSRRYLEDQKRTPNF